MVLLSLLRVLSLVASADIPESSDPAQSELQRVSMRLLFDENTREDCYDNAYFHEYINASAGMDTDPCTWRGIECTGHEVTSLIMTVIHITESLGGNRDLRTARYVKWVVAMDWLPPTLRTIHLNRLIFTNGWLAERLPRELRYFCAIRCNVPLHKDHHREIHLQRLPRKLEEMHVHEGWYRGKVFLLNLPKTLGLLVLLHEHFHKVYVDSSDLPANLRNVLVMSMFNKIKIKEISEMRRDSRIQRRRMQPEDFTPQYDACTDAVDGHMREFVRMRRAFARSRSGGSLNASQEG